MSSLFPPRKPPPPIVLARGGLLDFSRPLVMAIVNCTPDSFYGKSRNLTWQDALAAALRFEEEGADVIDFGAEPSGPGSRPVPVETEISRLIPALKAFRARSNLPVSVDTRNAAAARAALDEGADMINDVSAFASSPDMAALCAQRNAAAVLTHALPFEKAGSFGKGIGGEVRNGLKAAIKKALAAGLARGKIILDPGIGFGKDAGENLFIIANLAKIFPQGYPVVVGLSRKRFIGEICGREAAGRLAGTVAAHYAALCCGADMLRVHDTVAAKDAVSVFMAIERTGR